MKIKVCGLRDPENIENIATTDYIDYLGFIFYPPSSRYLKEVTPALRDILDRCAAEPVGVFVNEDPKLIDSCLQKLGSRTVQLHGDESPDICSLLKSDGYTVIKAFSVDEAQDFSVISAYIGHIDYALLDTKGAARGGNGVAFDWSLLVNYNYDLPFFLSGGIGPEDGMKIKKISHPQLKGVDINSRFELSPALKDVSMVKKFIHEISHQ